MSIDYKVLGDYQELLSNSIDMSEMKISHYTSMLSLKNIIENRSFRSSHGQYMNDPLDGVSLYKAVLDLIKDDLYSTRAYPYIDQIINNYQSIDSVDVAEDLARYRLSKKQKIALRLFRVMAKYMQGKFQAQGTFPVSNYVLSFSEYNPDESVSSWISYGDDGRGVRIDFDASSFYLSIQKSFLKKKISFDNENKYQYRNEPSISVSRCVYRTEDQILDMASDIYENFIDKYQFFQKYNYQESFYVAMAIEDLSLIIKRSEYSNEKEIRIIFKNIPGSKSPRFGNYFGVEFDYSEKKNSIIRKINFNFDVKSLKNICVGPRCDVLSANSIVGFVKNFHGISCDITKSTVSYAGK